MENKIRKKTLYYCLFGKVMCAKIESKFEGQVTYLEYTMKSYSTPLSPYTYAFY